MQQTRQDIAIIGMSCRFPDADNPSQFWENIRSRRTSFETLENQRWDHSSFFSPSRRAPNASYSTTAALLDGLDQFAAKEFKVSPRRAKQMDPQQRLILELSREALQDAGLEGRDWNREESAVFVGASVSEYSNLMTSKIRAVQMRDGQLGTGELDDSICADIIDSNAYTLPGHNISMCASAVAQTFGCGGPAITVDAACAASTAALIQGVNYLKANTSGDGPAPVALVGGVYLLLLPDNLIGFAKLGALAKEQCCPFDPRATGFILGEGAAVLTLKRLDHAIRDSDRVYSVIKGVSWTNDGANVSPTQPKSKGQVRALRKVLKNAQFEPESVQYIECHGTGTPVGDPVELESLTSIWEGSNHRPRLGSVKANIGHTLTVSGLAGVIRAAMAIHRRELPPQAGWESWHPALENCKDNFRIETESAEWKSDCRRALVNSFAFGGTNCIVALGEAPDPSIARSGHEEQWFHFSASDPDLLGKYLAEVGGVVERSRPCRFGLSRTLRLRKRYEYSVLLQASSHAELATQLEIALDALVLPPERITQVSPQCSLGPTEEFDSQLLDFQVESSAPIVDLPLIPLRRESYWFSKSMKRSKDCPRHRFLSRADEAPKSLGLDITRTTLNIEEHPFLVDHSIQGRPMVPFAYAVDWMAGANHDCYPMVLRDAKVERGCFIKKSTTLEMSKENDRILISEVRPTGRRSKAFSAHVGGGELKPPVLSDTSSFQSRYCANRFYQRTFHGPRLAGILQVIGYSEKSIKGRVRTSVVRDWIPDSQRQCWAIDPLVIDSAFQLALFWILEGRNQALLPQSVDEIVMLEPLISPGVTVEVYQRDEDEKGATADFLFTHCGKTVGWMKGATGKYVSPRSIAPNVSVSEKPQAPS